MQSEAASADVDDAASYPATHTKIEEVGSANFFGITADNEFVTPLSPSILNPPFYKRGA